MDTRYQPIENYGVIGDMHTIALVGMNGSIDFMSFPHFDSPTIFASILDADKGGSFSIQPHFENCRHKQLYLPDTNILLTRFLADSGVAELSDFMPIEEERKHNIVRRVKTVRGDIHYEMTFAPKFNYARSSHKIEKLENGYLFISEGDDQTKLFFLSSVPLEIINSEAKARFELKAGETATFIMEGWDQEQTPCCSEEYAVKAFKETSNFWRNWLRQSTYRGRWREMVDRSALVLKMLTFKPKGSIVAAPTFGLPEEIGGERNWDYRYTWIRDASFTLYGLIRLGFTQEAHDFMGWLEKRCSEIEPDGSLQIMYGIDGEHDLHEHKLDHLEGYMQSSPVRVGNGAYDQLQLDIYGELLDSIYLYDKYRVAISYDLWQNIVKLIEWVCDHWNHKDEGIWEVRGGKQHFLYSRLMCWVALDRAIRLSQKRSFPAPRDKWLACRDTIHEEIFNEFWNEELQAFVQHKGSITLDASVLLMPLVRFISPTDPRWLSTLDAIERELVDDSLVYRYKVGKGAPDGLMGEEGTFCMCSFWFTECLSRAGDLPKARFIFEKVLGYSNHLGLYAEELGPRGEHLGNFPQAFTHLSLISSAYDLNRRLNQ